MKRTVETTDGGFESYLGEYVLLLCANYFYAGKLAGVGADHVELEDAQIVYETGAWGDPGFADAQKLPANKWLVQKQSIESWGTHEKS